MIAEECSDCEYNNRDYGCMDHDCEIYQYYQQEKKYDTEIDIKYMAREVNENGA